MNTKAEQAPSAIDTIKLLLAIAVLIGGIVGNYWFENESVLLRAAGIIVALALACVIAFQSLQGQMLWRFIQSSRTEIRKVIWPTQQETLQTTLTVIVFTLIMGVFFWILDMILLWATGILTGQGG